MVTAAQFSEEKLNYIEAARIVGVTPQSLRRWVSEELHDFPRGFKVGKRRWFLRSEVERWLESRRSVV